MTHDRRAFQVLAVAAALTALPLATPEVVEAQTHQSAPAPSTSTLRFTLGATLGAGPAYPSDGGATGGLTYERGGHAGGIRAALVGGVLAETYADVALLYGRVWRGERGFASFSAGPGYVMINETSCLFCRPVESEHTLGAALSADWGYALWRHFGIGVSAFANINAKQSFGGTALAFSLGRLL
ncbi:MAG TPA: hypothetical protein VML95_07400 [Longimicrobiales bacterium]|nr:hypothetical protein [Longimicrobiales bacterium]